MVATKQALTDAALILDEDQKDRAGVYWGTGMGSAHTIESNYVLLGDSGYRPPPSTVIMTMNNTAAAQISMDFGLRGPSLTYSTACSSSAVAIGEAFHSIRYGMADAAIAGGAESLLTYGVIRA